MLVESLGTAYAQLLTAAESVPAWTDEQVIQWDDNFKDDGTLFLPCSERDVDVHEYRRVLQLAQAHFARSGSFSV